MNKFIQLLDKPYMLWTVKDTIVFVVVVLGIWIWMAVLWKIVLKIFKLE